MNAHTPNNEKPTAATVGIFEGTSSGDAETGNKLIWDGQPIKTEAEAFLDALDPYAKEFTFQTFDDNQDRKDGTLAVVLNGTLNQHWDRLCTLSAKGAGIFVTINQTNLQGRTKDHVIGIRAVFVDTDGADVEPIRAANPHFLVESSAGNYHAYWNVIDCPLEDFTPAQKAMIAAWGTDKGIHDLPRVMRLPGFVHQKISEKKGLTGVPFMVRMIHAPKPIGMDDWADRKAEIAKLVPMAPALPLSARALANVGKPKASQIKGKSVPSLEEVQEVLGYIPCAKLDYGDWLNVIMALHWLGDEYEDLAHNWSADDERRYDPDDLDAKWRGFSENRSGGVVTWATACSIAKKHGADLARIASKYAPKVQPVETDEDDYVRTAKGAIVPIFANVRKRLTEEPWAGVFAYNEMSGQFVRTSALAGMRGNPRLKEPVELEAEDYAHIEIWLQRNFHMGIKEGDTIRAVKDVCKDAVYHPVRNYLNSLEEPDNALFDTWLFDILGCAPKDDQERTYLVAIGRAWLISAVARIMEPGCKAEAMLVLEGTQGRKKSSFFEALAGKEYFADSLPPMGTPAAADYVRGKWIIEVAELDGMNKADTEAAKSFISRKTERFRPAYGRHEITYQRQCVFGGTTNRSEYLRDETGNRRFWPVECGEVDLVLLKEKRDGLWAAAVAAYKAGEKWWLSSAIEDLAKNQQAKRYVHDIIEEEVMAAVGERDTVALSDIVRRVIKTDWKPATKVEENRVRNALVALGFKNIGRHRKGDRVLTLYQKM